jgi:eukaryotic-like serine/threonine-protein kinase
MTNDRQPQITALYHAALGRDERQRPAFLREPCAGDDALRREVQSLLGHEDAAASLLSGPSSQRRRRA